MQVFQATSTQSKTVSAEVAQAHLNGSSVTCRPTLMPLCPRISRDTSHPIGETLSYVLHAL